MEEHEVDLRDYLRVLWRGKWIVLATFLVAVGVAAVVSFKAPDVFRAEARLTVKDLSSYYPVLAPASRSTDEKNRPGDTMVSLEEVAEWAKAPAVWEEARALAGDKVPPADWLLSHSRVKVEGSLLELVLEGPESPTRLQVALSGLVAALQARSAERIRKEVEKATASLEARERALARRQAALEEELAQLKSAAQTQREEILSQIAERQDAPPEELGILYARLQAVELQLDKLERMGIYALPGGAETILYLEKERLALETEKEQLHDLQAAPPVLLELVRGPAASSTPVGPNRKMNLAVAGVLGLFCGVLLAFFWHWLREPTRVPGKAGPEQQGPAQGRGEKAR